MFSMHVQSRHIGDQSRWSQDVIDLSAPERVLPLRVRVPAIPINKGSGEDVDCRVGDRDIDVDYMDIAIHRGKLQRFIGSPFINFGNPMLKEVSLFTIIEL